jgi:hypothetical protein
MSTKIPFDAARLKSRWSQPRMTRVEALKQLRATMPLTPSALKELQSSNGGSKSGLRRTAS